MKQPLDHVALDQLFREARSHDHYLDRPVTAGQLQMIWDLMKMGPTSANMLPARLIWCHSQAARDRLAALAADSNQQKIKAAPVAVIIAMDQDFHEHLPTYFPHVDAKSWFVGDADARVIHALRNSSLQGAYLIMAARALGLDVGPMSGFDNDAVDHEFFADQPRVKSNFIATLGYGDSEKLHPRGPRPDFDIFNQLI